MALPSPRGHRAACLGRSTPGFLSPSPNAAAHIPRYTWPPPPRGPVQDPLTPPSGAIVNWHLDLDTWIWARVGLGLVSLPQVWPCRGATAGRGAGGRGTAILGPHHWASDPQPLYQKLAQPSWDARCDISPPPSQDTGSLHVTIAPTPTPGIELTCSSSSRLTDTYLPPPIRNDATGGDPLAPGGSTHAHPTATLPDSPHQALGTE